jgi:hypothetical protein
VDRFTDADPLGLAAAGLGAAISADFFSTSALYERHHAIWADTFHLR